MSNENTKVCAVVSCPDLAFETRTVYRQQDAYSVRVCMFHADKMDRPKGYVALFSLGAHLAATCDSVKAH